jgi:hypothetical protein
MMTIQDDIKMLRFSFTRLCDALAVRDDTDCKAIDAFDRIEAAIPRWIPVSERLPDDFVWVLATDGDSVMIAHRLGGCWNPYRRIIAWQPLPQTYKEPGVDETGGL